MAHVSTQIPYASIVFVSGAIGYVLAGIMGSPWIPLAATIVLACVGFVAIAKIMNKKDAAAYGFDTEKAGFARPFLCHPSRFALPLTSAMASIKATARLSLVMLAMRLASVFHFGGIWETGVPRRMRSHSAAAFSPLRVNAPECRSAAFERR